MKTVVKATENILFAAAVAIMVCALACQLLHLKPVVVVSGSMEPSIMTGSLAFIDKKDKVIEEGDIISFYAGDALVTHRVIEITENGYRTKGDNNESADAGLVTDSQLEGTLIFNLQGMGFFLKVVALPIGTATTLLYIIMKGINKGKRND